MEYLYCSLSLTTVEFMVLRSEALALFVSSVNNKLSLAINGHEERRIMHDRREGFMKNMKTSNWSPTSFLRT
jgi:hypothetical protein